MVLIKTTLFKFIAGTETLLAVWNEEVVILDNNVCSLISRSLKTSSVTVFIVYLFKHKYIELYNMWFKFTFMFGY